MPLPAAKNFFWLAGSEIVVRGVNFLLNLYLIRVLSVENFGYLGIATSLLSYFVLAASFGLEPMGRNALIERREATHTIVSAIVVFRLALGVALSGAFFVVVFFIASDQSLFLLCVILGAQILISAGNVGFHFLAQERMKVIAAANIVSILATAAAMLVLVRAPERVVEAGAIYTVALALNHAMLFGEYLRSGGRVVLRGIRKEGAALAKKGVPVILASFFILVYLNSDILILSYFATPKETGLYAAAYKVTQTLALVSGIAFTAMAKPLLTAWRTGMEAFSEQFAMYLRFILNAIVVILLPLCFFPELLATVLLGAKYAGVETSLLLLAVSTVFVFLSIGFGHPLQQTLEKTTTYLRITAFGAALNVLLNFLLIPRYGKEGAAIATLATNAALCAVFAAAFFRHAKGASIAPLFRRWGFYPAVIAGYVGLMLFLPSLGVIESLVILGVYMAAVGMFAYRAVLSVIRPAPPTST